MTGFVHDLRGATASRSKAILSNGSMPDGPRRGNSCCGSGAGRATSISKDRCEECRGAAVTLQHFPAGSTALSDAPTIVHDVLGSPGRSLEPAIRATMESRLGHDFSRVRVHSDARGAESARAVGAFAYTAGTDVVFAGGRYAPGTATGAELLAHELTHTVQQSRLTGPVSSGASAHLEMEANTAAARSAGSAIPQAAGLDRRPSGRQLTANMIQRQLDPRAQPMSPKFDGVTVIRGKQPREFIVTAHRMISPAEFYVLSVALGRDVSLAKAQKLIDARDEVGCIHPNCQTGLQPGETVGFYFGPKRTSGKPKRSPQKQQGKARRSRIAEPPERAVPEPPVGDVRLFPGVEDALESPEMQRFFGLRQRYHRLFPHQTAPDFRQLQPDEYQAFLELCERLEQFTETDWELLERSIGRTGPVSPARGWSETNQMVAGFLGSSARSSALHEVDVRDARIQAAVAGIDVVEEKRVTERLGGVEGLYQDIKAYEAAPSGSGEFRYDFQRRKEQYRKAMEGGLARADFEDVAKFDDAVRALRLVVRRRAIATALLTLKESERVLSAELQRYREPGEYTRLFNELARWRRLPPPSTHDRQRLLDTYRLLMSPVAWKGALAAKYPEWLGETLRQNAEAQLNNITKSRESLHDNPEIVFNFDHVIDETLKQMGFGPTSIQARLIREGRAKPGRRWSQKLFDVLLLALSFASGPLGWVGWAAQAVALGVQVHQMAARQARDDVVSAAAHAGKPLASPPSTSGQEWEVLGFFTSLLGVSQIPAAKADLLFTKARGLVSKSLPEPRAGATEVAAVVRESASRTAVAAEDTALVAARKPPPVSVGAEATNVPELTPPPLAQRLPERRPSEQPPIPEPAAPIPALEPVTPPVSESHTSVAVARTPTATTPPDIAPKVRGATGEGVGPEFRYEYYPELPPSAVERLPVRGDNRARASGQAAEHRPAPESAAPEQPSAGSRETRAREADAPDEAMRDRETEEMLSGARTAEDEVPIHPDELEQLSTRFGGDRFDAKMTEEELAVLAQELFPQYTYDPRLRGKIVVHQGKVRPGQSKPKGSTVPDLYLRGARRRGEVPRRPPISLEAKNYFVGGVEAREEFLIATIRQARQRAAALPRTARQHVLIDLRGQEVTREFADALRRELAMRSGRILRPDRIHFLPSWLN